MINKEIMEKCLISVTDQLAIIKEARKILINLQKGGVISSFGGLCVILKGCIYDLPKEESRSDDIFNIIYDKNYIYIRDYLPMFTFENAKQCTTTTDGNEFGYWWNISPYDFSSRLKFLDWMEEDILK